MLRATDEEDALLGKETSDDNSSPPSSSLATTAAAAAAAAGTSILGKSLALRIKSFKDVEIQINDSSSVAQVKQAVRSALGEQADGRYLRLICKGRLLAPDTSALRDFAVDNDDVLHAVLAAAGIKGGQQAQLARGISRRYRGTGVGAGGRAVRSNHNNNNNNGTDNDDDDDSGNDASGDEEEGGRTSNSYGNSTERLGFNRLRTTGLSRSEVSAIRSYFSRNVDRFVQSHPEVAAEAANGETDLRRRRLLHEDAWMITQGPTSEFRFNLNQNNPLLRLSAAAGGGGSSGSPVFRPGTVGTDRDLVWGFLLGFFVGFFMLVYVWVPTVPHKQKLGILAGISFQLALNFLKDPNGVDGEDFVED